MKEFTVRHGKTPNTPRQPNRGVMPPRNVTARKVGNYIEIKAPAGSVTANSQLDVYLVRALPADYFDRLRLGTLVADASGAISGTVPSILPYVVATAGNLVALTTTTAQSDTSEFSATITIV